MSRIPTSWAKISLLDCAEFVRGVTYTKADASETPSADSVPIMRANNIQRGKLDLGDMVYVPAHLVSPSQLLRPGDVVIATSSGSISVVGKAAQIRREVGLSFGAFCGALRPNTEVCARYFGHFFSSKGYRDAVSDMARGVNINNLKRDHFAAIQLPMAPEPEQRRIADKLDTVLARVDAVNDRLARVAPLLKRFRQSVLAAATSGRLTAEWRGFELPEWLFERADSVCEKVQSGGTPKVGFVDEGVPFLKVYNIVDQKIAFDYRAQYVSQQVHEGELRKSQTVPGDVLMNIVGPPLGKVAVVPLDHPRWNINQAITLFRPSDRVSAAWLYIVLCEGAPIRAVLSSTKGSVGQVNISLSQCRAFEIPVPPVAEQAEIVRRVELLFAYADRLEARLQAAQTAADRMTPALLAKAFRGELVPQDPSDEPASELLKRVAALGSGGGGRKRARS